MNKGGFIFHDTGGGRWRTFKIVSFLGASTVAAALVVFVGSLLITPQLDAPVSLAQLKARLGSFPARARAAADALAGSARPKPAAGQPAPRAGRRGGGPGIKAAFLDPGDAAAIRSLEAHGAVLTHLCPGWLNYSDPARGLTPSEDAVLEDLPLHEHQRLLPVLSNLDGDRRAPEAVEALAWGGEAEKDSFIGELASTLEAAKADGVVLDWQEVEQGGGREVGELVARIADGLRARGLETWLAVTPDATFGGWDFAKLGGRVDRFVLRLDEEHGETGLPGPLASQDWVEGWLTAVAAGGNAGKWVASLGARGLDWEEGKTGAGEISFADAMSRAGNAGCADVATLPPAFNGTFSYHFNGAGHEVWFLDAVSFANQLNAVRAAGLSGVAVDRIGLEDPGIWPVLAADGTASTGSLDAMIPGGDAITSIGRGEVVNLDPTSFPGHREFRTEPDGRITARYAVPPAHPTLFRMGGGDPSRVALTFDDGPDPEWTPAILDILAARGIKAMFFIVGSEAERYPDLIRRIAAEGHEIGNHSYSHPDLASAPEALIRLELNATQRLVESLTGRSTALFRPPYDADSRPSNLEELTPIRVAQSLGYMTVLENIDPRDWQEPGGAELLRRVKEARASGNILLLHDGGGDRSATVEALPAILDYLQERGDRVVKISELVGIDEDELMPPVVPGRDRVGLMASGTGFRVLRILQEALRFFLIAASILVLVRTLLVVVLAALHRTRRTPPKPGAAALSVVIPAFNEEPVIAQTIRSILASDYDGPLEVVVVDDGSTDGTAAVVEALGDPRVRLVRQENSGKARALQNGVDQSSGGILVFIDADTQFDPAALGHLAGALCDPRVGAVSGQARVGNLRTFVARCQELEYVCNFNLDRRAYAAWNCITVVPGAISAIRREALEAAGGYSADTLAEDTDLTLAIHRAGYRVEYAPEAVARTEAPETMRLLARQRFRWAFGTLQCIWKHRDLMFNPRFKALGWFSLPSIWFFQVLLVAFSPVIDILLLQSLLLGHAADILPYFLAFLVSDLVLAFVAVAIEGLPARMALRIIPQRFLYRPLLSYVIWRSLLHAVRGAWVGWGKVPRTASVSPA